MLRLGRADNKPPIWNLPTLSIRPHMCSDAHHFVLGVGQVSEGLGLSHYGLLQGGAAQCGCIKCGPKHRLANIGIGAVA